MVVKKRKRWKHAHRWGGGGGLFSLNAYLAKIPEIAGADFDQKNSF